MAPRAPTVLFVCVRNAGRSQMAAALLRHHAGDAIEVRSAGSAPADQVHPVVLEAMREIGIDLGTQQPQLLTDAVTEGVGLVVTMGCGDACPAIAGARTIDWDLDDPGEQPIEHVRAIRDEIDARVRALRDEILA